MAAEKPGTADSAIVGTSGRSLERSGVVTASANSWPALTLPSPTSPKSLTPASQAFLEIFQPKFLAAVRGRRMG